MPPRAPFYVIEQKTGGNPRLFTSHIRDGADLELAISLFDVPQLAEAPDFDEPFPEIPVAHEALHSAGC
jgi:hypothetical protein